MQPIPSSIISSEYTFDLVLLTCDDGRALSAKASSVELVLLVCGIDIVETEDSELEPKTLGIP